MKTRYISTFKSLSMPKSLLFYLLTTLCSGIGMGVPLFLRDMRNPLRVMGAWGSGAGLESTSFDFVPLDIVVFYLFIYFT